MWRASRILALLGVAALGSVSLAKLATGQLAGTPSGAVSFAPTDPVALGDSSLSSVRLGVGDGIFSLGGGAGLGKAAVRAYLGAAPQPGEARWLVAVGYVRTLASRTLIGPLRASLGAEANAGFRHALGDMSGLGLTVPLGASLGRASGVSLGVYLAPYAETNFMRRWVAGRCSPGCNAYITGPSLSGAVGTGLGVRLSAGPVSVSAMMHDMLASGPSLQTRDGDLSLGVTIRLGR